MLLNRLRERSKVTYQRLKTLEHMHNQVTDVLNKGDNAAYAESRGSSGLLDVRLKPGRAKMTDEKFLKVANMILCIQTFKVIPVHSQNLKTTELPKERSEVLQPDADNRTSILGGITTRTSAALRRQLTSDTFLLPGLLAIPLI